MSNEGEEEVDYTSSAFNLEETEEETRGGRFEKSTGDMIEDNDGEDRTVNRGQPLKSVEGWVIFVSNLHEETPEEYLVDKFEEYGILKSVHMNLDKETGLVKGYALLEYEDYNEAKQAIDEMNGTELLGEEDEIRVSWAFTAK